VIIIGCVDPLPSAVRGPFPGCSQPVVPSREVCGPGGPNEKQSLIQRKLAPCTGMAEASGSTPGSFQCDRVELHPVEPGNRRSFVRNSFRSFFLLYLSLSGLWSIWR
jgi:hypothetical protein